MNEMIERVAKVLCGFDCRDHGNRQCPSPCASWRLFEENARAAIEAMKEPTEAILNAGAKSCADERGNPDEVSARSAWGVMLAAALK